MTKRFDAIIFDFDYTLADSSRAVVECANGALVGLGLPPASEEAIRRTIGLSLPETFARLAGERYREQVHEFRRLWRRRSDEIMVDWTEVFEGVPAAIESLKDRGLLLAIASTKFRSRIEAVLRRERLVEKFDVIVGGDDVTDFKPDPEALLLAMKGLRSAKETTLCVGDSLTDAEAARRAGLPFAAVLSGVTTRIEFDRLPVTAFVESVSELPALLGPR